MLGYRKRYRRWAVDMNGQSRTCVIATCAVVLSLAAPIVGAAQFDDWLTVHSGPDYDFLVNPGSLAPSPGDVDSLRVHRVIINRMLVRQREPERRRLVAWRRAAGLPTEGYDAYASTAEVVEIRCANGRYSVWESTDFGEGGKKLDSRLNERAWHAPSAPDSVPMRAVLNWACSNADQAVGGPITLQPDDIRWITVSFDGRGETRYQASQRDGRACVEAVADQSASALAMPISDHPAGDIEWSWRVDSLVMASHLDGKDGDDYSARLLVNFAFDSEREGWFSRLKHSLAGEQYGGEAPGSALSYVWSGRDSVGTVAPSPYTSRVRMIVLDSGPGDVGSWRRHQRDLVADYRAAFGNEPPPVTSVALFTDADDTRSAAVACYGGVALTPSHR